MVIPFFNTVLTQNIVYLPMENVIDEKMRRRRNAGYEEQKL